MIEVLFTESAAGSMQYAKSLGNAIGEATSVVIFTDDGSEPTREELEQARAQAEEARRKWLETAIPMEGSPRDVVHLPLALSMGDISEPLSDSRAAFLQSMILIEEKDFADIGNAAVAVARTTLERIQAAAENGAPIRVWYSQNPDELCGFCHLMTLIPEETEVHVVELPAYEVKDSCVIGYSGWGEVDPGQFAAFLPRQRRMTATERRYFISQWKQLVRENGPLRAVVNGRLMTVGEDFYDGFILRELAREGETFHEARLIGNVLGRNQLGITDWLVAARIEAFIARGMLTPLTIPEENCPIYHRLLRKEK